MTRAVQVVAELALVLAVALGVVGCGQRGGGTAVPVAPEVGWPDAAVLEAPAAAATPVAAATAE